MPLDAKFYEAVETLLVPGMGTENVGPLLYSLARILRPRTVLEVGLGYTTPFILQALMDDVEEFRADRKLLKDSGKSAQRASILLPQHFENEYSPRLHAIDDYSTEGTSAPRVMDTVKTLGLSHLIDLHKSDFRGYSKKLDAGVFPVDLAWFDCGGINEYVDFLEEYWPLINDQHGLLILHYTYWPFPDEAGNWDRKRMLLGPLANEIKKQQVASGIASRFEVLSLLEPHKFQQGSVTMIRKLAPDSICREAGFQDEVEYLYGSKPKPLIKL